MDLNKELLERIIDNLSYENRLAFVGLNRFLHAIGKEAKDHCINRGEILYFVDSIHYGKELLFKVLLPYREVRTLLYHAAAKDSILITAVLAEHASDAILLAILGYLQLDTEDGDVPNIHGQALHTVIFNKRLSWARKQHTLQLLLGAGINIDECDEYDMAVLEVAIAGCDLKAVELLLCLGADVSARKYLGSGIVEYALDDFLDENTCVEQYRIMNLLLDYGAEYSESALLQAAWEGGCHDLLRCFATNNKLDVNHCHGVLTPLTIAVEHELPNIIDQLIGAGACYIQSDKHFMNILSKVLPYDLAAHCKADIQSSNAVIDSLCKLDLLELSQQSSASLSAMCIALSSNLDGDVILEIVRNVMSKIEKKKRFDVFEKCRPLHFATRWCRSNPVPALRYFLEEAGYGAGMYVNWQDEEGMTPLHWLTLNDYLYDNDGYLEIERLFEDFGADLSLKNAEGVAVDDEDD